MTGESADQLMRAPEEPEQSEGISWGMADDTAPEYNIPENRELDTSEDAWFMKDPKKILKNWMEHHGYDFDFTYEEHMEGKEKQYAARISLPIETGFGAYAMGLGSRKKDAERECAVDACRKLDAAGILRSDPAEISSKKRERIKAMLGEDDSDEDTFYDRTGLIEKKKSKPKKVEPQVETFESLNKKKEELAEEIAGVENEIRDVELKLEAQKNLDMSDLDVYMSSLSSTVTDVTKYKLEKKLEELQKSMAKLNQLIKIATPSLGSFSTIHGLKEAEKPAPKADPKPEAPKKVELPKVVDPTAFASFRPDDEEEEEEDDRSREKPQPQPQPQPQARPAEPQPVVKRAPTQVPTIPNPDAKRKIAEVSEEAKEEEEGKQTEAGTQQRAEKKKRVYGAMTKERFDELTGGDELVAWEPPKNQTGDGRTSLNDKFGY